MEKQEAGQRYQGEELKAPEKEARRVARGLRAARKEGTAEGWRRRVAAGAAQRTRLERRKNWLQLAEMGRETVRQLQPALWNWVEASQVVLSLFHSLPSFLCNDCKLRDRESDCLAV